MVDKKETIKTYETKDINFKDASIEPTMFQDIDTDKQLEITHMDIIDSFNKTIDENDTTTHRLVKIISLPKSKWIESEEYTGWLMIMQISDKGKPYLLTVNAKSTRMSLMDIAIRTIEQQNNEIIKDKSKISLDVIIGKYYMLGRTRMKAKGYPEKTPFKFYMKN